MNNPHRHLTAWQDGGSVALKSCDGVELEDQPTLSTDQKGGEVTCPRCGTELYLYWDVHIDERPTIKVEAWASVGSHGGIFAFTRGPTAERHPSLLHIFAKQVAPDLIPVTITYRRPVAS